MLYGLRDEAGTLIAVGKLQLTQEWEPIDKQSDEVRQFLRKQTPEAQALEEADSQFIRVLDDLIELMIEKNLIQFTELPDPAQQKLLKRRWYRQQIRGDEDTNHFIDPQEGLL